MCASPMGGYLETQTAEKLQEACNTIIKTCDFYTITELYKSGVIPRREYLADLKKMGLQVPILPEDANSKTIEEKPADQVPIKFVTTKLLAKMLKLDPESADWFWYSTDIFTTTDPMDPNKEQVIPINEIKRFLCRKSSMYHLVMSYSAQSAYEQRVKNTLLDE